MLPWAARTMWVTPPWDGERCSPVWAYPRNWRQWGIIAITGIVGGAGSRDPVMLQSVRLSIVMKMADCICEGICLVERLWENAAII